MADVPTDVEFPVWGLMPKKETGVVAFQTKYPEYDGRGTVIAIFDSGVDPAAEGLKVTSTGETKVIERIDCSGCGDVDTSATRKVVDGFITGLTGRKLKISESWSNPSSTYRVGVLYPYSIYPSKLRERVQEHRKHHVWDVGHKAAVAAASKQLQDYEAEIASKGANLSPEEKQQKEELEARVEVLNNAEKKFTDLGPTYDVVLFHDGTVWRACIDTSETGDLAAGVCLGEYSETHEHAHLTSLDEMTVSINVHEDGAVLEVVGLCSSHGTHVACIAAGHFPDEPDKSGVAPGAKLISLTIGDGRLGSMETGTALVRACVKVMELCKTHRVDVINMSYGEHAHWSNSGRIGDLICEVVNRYNVNWVVSAGNHGPALCTVGAPPDIKQTVLIGVGAYVSPGMMAAAYSMRQQLNGTAFSWSSRGPAPDGAMGLSVAAPGGAVTSVARFTLRHTQLMNGTSMAAPHVAGVVSALVSGLKARGLGHSPYSMKRALENGATYLPHVEPWAQGGGLVNVEKTFELLTSFPSELDRDVTFSVSVGPTHDKGILLRPHLGDAPKDFTATVEPRFLQSHTDMEDRTVIPKQIAFNVRLALACGAAWVSAPAFVDMMNAARPLSLRIDPSALPAGAHFASINAFDVNCLEKGPVFRIPITVLQPEPLASTSGAPQITGEKVLFNPGTVKRHFVVVPAEATWAVLKLWTADKEKTGRFLVHCMQLLPKKSCRCHETQKLVNVTHEAPTVLPFQITGGVTLEIVIAKYWANIGELVVDYSVEFHGLKPDFGPRLRIAAADGVSVALLRALRLQDVAPQAQLKHSEPVYRPSESKLAPLTARDVIPPSRQIYQLINTYTFHIAKATEVSPIVSTLCDMLYESEFEAQMWMLYNSSKQLMAVGDAFPSKAQMWMLYNSSKQLMAVGDAFPSKYTVKLEKGEYTLRLNVRHDSKALLEKLQDLPIAVQTRLPSPLTLDAYASHSAALTGGKKFGSVALSSGSLLPVYFAPLPADKVGRTLTVGQALTGTVTFAKDELGRKVDTYPLHLFACEPPKRPSQPKDKEKNKPHDDYLDAYKDFVAGWLSKLEGDKLEQVYEELVEKFPGYLGAHVAYLNALDAPTDAKKLPRANDEPDVTAAWCDQVIGVADKVIKNIDQEKLLAYLGIKNDTRSDANKIKQDQEKQKGYLVEALCRRGTALCRLLRLAGTGQAGGAGGELERRAQAARDNMADLLKFTDLTDSKAIHYGVWHYFTLKQWGKAIKLLTKIQEDRPSKEVEERLIEAYQQLGWDYFAQFASGQVPVRFPQAYRPF